MKKTSQRIFFPILAIAFILIFAAPATAQSPISATVDRATLSTDDILTLNVSVSAEGQPVLPSLDGFNVLGSGTSSQISIINGNMSTQVTYTYRLQPTRAGTLTIEPVMLTSNGQTYTTAPITVQVEQGTGRPPQRNGVPSGRPAMPNLQSLLNSMLGGGIGQLPSPGSGIGQLPSLGGGQSRGFVEAEVSNPNPYLGEQIVYTVRYYQDSGDVFGLMDQPQVIPPAFSGFWSESSTGQNNYRAQAKNGRIFNVTELTTVLIPTKPGELTIEPARLSIPGGFFEPGAELATEPVTVNVQPLPANAPAGFNGAVGQFSIEARADSTQSKVNEPVTWYVTLTGSGNIQTMANPDWPEMPGWRSFESNATVNTQIQNGKLVGTRSYERLLVPQNAGEFTIPALEFTYFDPEAGRYQTVSTQPIPVSVAPGAGGTSPQAGASTLAPISTAAGAAQNTTPDTGLRQLKPAPQMLVKSGGPVTDSPLYWLAWFIPLVGLAGNFVWQKRQDFRAANAGLVRRSQAAKKAKRALARARKSSDDVYTTAGQILTTYLSDRLDRPVLGLTEQARTQLLADRQISTELAERVNSCLSAAEAGRFAPEAADPAHAQHLLVDIELLIHDLEKSFGRPQ